MFTKEVVLGFTSPTELGLQPAVLRWFQHPRKVAQQHWGGLVPGGGFLGAGNGAAALGVNGDIWLTCSRATPHVSQ